MSWNVRTIVWLGPQWAIRNETESFGKALHSELFPNCPPNFCTGVKLIIGSKVPCMFCFEICTTVGRGGMQISKQSARNLWPKKWLHPCSRRCRGCCTRSRCRRRWSWCRSLPGPNLPTTGRTSSWRRFRQPWTGSPARGVASALIRPRVILYGLFICCEASRLMGGKFLLLLTTDKLESVVHGAKSSRLLSSNSKSAHHLWDGRLIFGHY